MINTRENKIVKTIAYKMNNPYINVHHYPSQFLSRLKMIKDYRTIVQYDTNSLDQIRTTCYYY